MALSKTQQALSLVRDGIPVADAARRAGVAPATVYIALSRTRGREQCPCCGQVIRSGFEVDAAVVRLDPEVLEALRASGEGWQARANEMLREFLIGDDDDEA